MTALAPEKSSTYRRALLRWPADCTNPQTSLFDDIAAEHQLKSPIHCSAGWMKASFGTRYRFHELRPEVVDTLDIPVLLLWVADGLSR